MKNSPNLTKNPMNETVFIIIGAYLAYSLAHLGFFQLSGDVAIFFYGVIVSHYTKYNMSETSFSNIGLSFNLIMQLAEAVCFIYIGLGVGDAVIGHQENIYYAMFILGVLFVSRSVVIGIAALVLKSAKLLVEPREYFPVIMSGMIKGPMAYIFANVLVPFRSPCLDIKDHHQYIQSYPLFVMQICVIFSLVVLTPINYLIFKLMVKKDSKDLNIQASSKDEERAEFKRKMLEGVWEINQKKPRVFEYVDEYFFKPALIRDYHERRDEIEKLKKQFDDLSGAYDHGVHLEHSILHGDGHHGHDDHGHDSSHDSSHSHGDESTNVHSNGHGSDEHQDGHSSKHGNKVHPEDHHEHDHKHDIHKDKDNHKPDHHSSKSPAEKPHKDTEKHTDCPDKPKEPVISATEPKRETKPTANGDEKKPSVEIAPQNTENLPDPVPVVPADRPEHPNKETSAEQTTADPPVPKPSDEEPTA